MLKEGKIGFREAGTLAVTTISTKVLFTSPRAVVEVVGNAGYAMTLISALTGLLGFYFIYLLVKRFRGRNLNDIFIEVYGRIPGRIIALALSVFFLVFGSVVMREFIELLKSYEMIMSPPSYLALIILISAAVLAYLGFEPLARVNYLFSYVAWGGLIMLFVLSFKYFRFFYLAPVFGRGIDSIIIHGLRRSSVYGEVLILAVIADSVQGRKEFLKAGLMALGASAWIISTSLLTFSPAFPGFYPLPPRHCPAVHPFRLLQLRPAFL